MSDAIVRVVMPELAESMTSAKVAAWLKGEGEPVVAGQALLEVETDKTTVEIGAPATGVLRRIDVAAGTDGVAVGTVLGIVQVGAIGAGKAGGITAPSRAVPAIARHEIETGASPAQAPLQESAEAADRADRHVSASPLAARMAAIAGLDLAELSRQAGGARIRRDDVERRLGHAPRALGPRTGSIPPTRLSDDGPPAQERPYDEVPLTAMRRVTAARLQQAKRDIPHFYLSVECNVTTLTRLRASLNAVEGRQLTVTDFLVVACALALRDVPHANATWSDNGLRVHRAIDVAVAVNTARGLVTPIVRDCQDKSLDSVSREVKRLVARARAGQLLPDEYTGGTFTISNLGMFGVTTATPIVNPPQSCILGAGAIERRPVAIGDGLAVGDVMTCTLAADHRAIDGATGAELIQAVRRRLEDPRSLTAGLEPSA